MLKNTKKGGHTFIMTDLVKKNLKAFVCCALAVCFVVSAYFYGVKTSQDDIVFEFKYSDKELKVEYYALKEDNTLLWQYGTGIDDKYTYGSYFSRASEGGYVNISKEDARELKRIIKKTAKELKPLSSNPIVSKKGGQAIFFKYKNKYYNMEYPKKDSDSIKVEQDMESLKEIFKACVDEYRISAEIY